MKQMFRKFRDFSSRYMEKSERIHKASNDVVDTAKEIENSADKIKSKWMIYIRINVLRGTAPTEKYATKKRKG